MATNGSVPESLPPKKRNQRESLRDAADQPVFKTPSPFWKQNGVRGTRRPQETPPISLLAAHSAAYHPLWPEMTSDPNPVLARTLDTFPTWGLNFASYERTSTWSDPDRSDPVTPASCWGPSYWNGVGPDGEFVHQTDHRLPSWYRPKVPATVVKPVPHSHYTRELLPRGEETRLCFEEKGRPAQAPRWQEKLYLQPPPHDWRVKQVPLPTYYYEFDSPPAKVERTEDRQQQQRRLPVARPPRCSTEQAKIREERPLVDTERNAASQKQRESTLSCTQLLSRFVEGSLIQLVGGQLKRVEELKMEDFEYCAGLCPELSLRKFTVQKITRSHRPGLQHLEVELEGQNNSKVSLEVCDEYPLFVCARGWSSCSPERTARLCCLPCHQLHLGDVCLALTPTLAQAPPTQPDTPERERADGTERPEQGATLGPPRKRHSSAPELRNLLQHQS